MPNSSPLHKKSFGSNSNLNYNSNSNSNSNSNDENLVKKKLFSNASFSVCVPFLIIFWFYAVYSLVFGFFQICWLLASNFASLS